MITEKAVDFKGPTGPDRDQSKALLWGLSSRAGVVLRKSFHVVWWGHMEAEPGVKNMVS
jgi:hypothetical protein